jgi:hypothetical protein
LCAYDVGSGELIERLDLLDQGGTTIAVVCDANRHERLVTSCCDCDPAGFPGTVLLSELDSKHFQRSIRRRDTLDSLDKHR